MSQEQFTYMTRHDKTCVDKIDENINLSIPWYLMAAYAYYVEDDPIISDAVYDRLVTKIIHNWDKIEHQHKYLLSLEQLQAGTYLGEYPSRVQGAIKDLRKI